MGPEAEFDPYHQWLGIRFPERPPNHYRLLGIDLYEKDPDVIAHAADRQMAHLRTFQHTRHVEWSQRLLNEVSSARVCLLDPTRKADYDRELRKTNPPEAPPAGEARSGERAKPRPIPETIVVDSADDFRLGRPGRSRRAGRKAPWVLLIAAAVTLAVGGYLYTTGDAQRLYRQYIARTEPAPVEPPADSVDPPEEDEQSDPSTVPPLPGSESQVPSSDTAASDVSQSNNVPEASPEAGTSGSPDSTSETDSNGGGSDSPTDGAQGSTPSVNVRPPWELASPMRGPKPVFASSHPIGAYLLIAAKREMPTAKALLQSLERGDRPADPSQVEATAMVQFLLERFWEGVDQAIQSIRLDETLSYAGTEVKVVGKTANALELESAGGHRQTFDLSRSSLDPRLAMALVQRTFATNPASAERLIGVFLAVDGQGDAEQADHYLRLAEQHGYSTDQLAMVLVEREDATVQPAQVAVTHDASGRLKPPADSAYQSARRVMLARWRDDPNVNLDDPQLAARLFDRATTGTTDTVAKYVLLREALILANKNRDTDVALRAIDALAKTYEVDGWKLRVAVIESAARHVQVGQRQALIDRIQLLSQQAVAEDQFAQAKRLADLALAIAKPLRDLAVLKRLQTYDDELQQIVNLNGQIPAALAALQKDANDAAAHGQFGRFLCFAKGDFAQGLPHLVKGDNENLKQVAESDLAGPQDVTAMIKLGDAWQVVAASKDGVEKRRILERAQYWYENALPQATREQNESLRGKIDNIVATIGRDEMVVRLTDLQPVSATVGYGTLGINQNPVLDNPRINRLPEINGEAITEYLWAHAPSQVEYLIPSGARFFSAVGILNAASQDGVRFVVVADGKPLFGSPVVSQMGQAVPIRVPLPPGTRSLMLMVDDVGNYSSDHTYWVSPVVTF